MTQPARATIAQPISTTHHWLIKVPEVTALFWIIKLLTTALGESTSDFLFQRFPAHPVFAIVIGAVGLAVALALQLTARRYIPWRYWLSVAMIAIFGTMAADAAHVALHVTYQNATVFFAALLAIIFVAWYFSERTLSIHSIVTLRRELFYWATVMATFALGTAAGDLTAKTLDWGYLLSTLLFLGLIALPTLGWKLRMNAILAFWFAYIVTRPLGASFADWLSKSTYGGLGFGDGWVSLALAVIAISLVAWLTWMPENHKAEQVAQSDF